MRSSRSRALAVAGLSVPAAALLIGAARFGLGGAGPDPAGATPETLAPVLLMLAGACIVGLAIERAPSVAWLAASAALTIGLIESASLARLARPDAEPEVWRWWSIAVCLAGLAAAATTVGYATDPTRRLGRSVPLLGALALTGVMLAASWALATPDRAGGVVADVMGPSSVAGDSPLGSLSAVTRSALGVVLAFVALGLLGDARPVAQRTRRRLAIDAPLLAGADLRERAVYAATWLRTFADEATPGRARAHRAALAERSRLARDLHAQVVPAVRSALADAERDGSAEALAASLREILREVDGLIGEQHAIQLEIEGLIPALEWLAERTEARSGVVVTIDVDDEGPTPADRPPPDVAAAAFRVARLALDNVVRHAPTARVALRILTSREAIRLDIVDDGPGIDPAARLAAARAGHRGLADMTTEAMAAGGSVSIERAGESGGTAVRFRWPAALRDDP